MIPIKIHIWLEKKGNIYFPMNDVISHTFFEFCLSGLEKNGQLNKSEFDQLSNAKNIIIHLEEDEGKVVKNE